MKRANIFTRAVLLVLVAFASVTAGQEMVTPEEGPVAAVTAPFTPAEKVDTNFLRGNAEADKVMCNGKECPPGYMCMRGSGGMYCMKHRV
ncbi:Hypothetical protein NocV09_02000110 [Nannochloropsis oceanica]